MTPRTERRRRAARLPWALLLAALAGLGAGAAEAPAQPRLVVSPEGPLRTLGEAVRRAAPGAVIVVRAGTYREPLVYVDKPLTIQGEGWPTLDGQGRGEILSVTADSVTIRGLRFANTGVSRVEDRAALRVTEVGGCRIEGNRFEKTFFGIYLAGARDCVVRGNLLRADPTSEEATGNGIHLWTARNVLVEDNIVFGHRDGMYFEFAHYIVARRNRSEGNLRYGLHFMFADDCAYEQNVFRRNGAGVAVMYTRRVSMTGNRFEDNWGSAAYGLLLKEIYDPVITRNVFARNTTGLFADGAVRIQAEGNRFVDNGWAVKLMASTSEGRFARNDFIGNTFDVSTNSRTNSVDFEGNYYDGYRGYDLNRDGVGDVPHRPVRLFSLLVEQNEPALILLRSIFIALLDRAEQLLPALTPETLVDERPAMRMAS